MNKRTPTLLSLALPVALFVGLILGAALWCTDGMPADPDLDAAFESTPVIASQRTSSQRDGREDRTRATDRGVAEGFYGAPVGRMFSWRFRYATTYRLETPSQSGDQVLAMAGDAVTLPFRGMLHMQILKREAENITVLVQGTDVDAELPEGVDPQGTASARSLSEAVEAWFLVRLDTRGAVQGYGFQRERTPQQRNFVRALIAGFFHTIPATPSANWMTEESDPTGIYAAAYRLVSSDSAVVEIERCKRTYTAIGKQASLPEHTLAGRSCASFDRRSSWLAGVKIDESMTMEIVEFSGRVHLAVRAQFESTTADWPGVDLDESQWPAFVSASGAGEDLASDSVANERASWRAATADVSLDELLAKLRQLIEAGATREASFYEAWELLSWKLALDPKVVAAAEQLLLNGSLDESTGSMLLSALGKGGSQEAQDTLLAVYGAAGLSGGWREAAAIAMFQLAEPTVDVLKTVTSRIRDLRDIGDLDATSMLLLGAIAPRNTAVLPNGKTAMIELIGLEDRMRDLGATGLWLDALSNAADPSVAPLAAKYLNDANPLVRESAVAALDLSNAADVAPRLIAAATQDPSRDVRLRAIEALGKRVAKAGRQTLRDLARNAKDPAIRRAAVQAVAGKMDATDRQVLAGIARRDPVQEIREAARQLLGNGR